MSDNIPIPADILAAAERVVFGADVDGPRVADVAQAILAERQRCTGKPARVRSLDAAFIAVDEMIAAAVAKALVGRVDIDVADRAADDRVAKGIAAFIESIREPTQAVAEAFAPYWHDNYRKGRELTDTPAREVWQAMLNAAVAAPALRAAMKPSD